ncbi:MAG: hypothetical protein O2794_02525 [bacterium]|nr:hypothetical protein [bacterium]
MYTYIKFFSVIFGSIFAYVAFAQTPPPPTIVDLPYTCEHGPCTFSQIGTIQCNGNGLRICVSEDPDGDLDQDICWTNTIMCPVGSLCQNVGSGGFPGCAQQPVLPPPPQQPPPPPPPLAGEGECANEDNLWVAGVGGWYQSSCGCHLWDGLGRYAGDGVEQPCSCSPSLISCQVGSLPPPPPPPAGPPPPPPPPPPSGQIGIGSCVRVNTGDETSLNVRSVASLGNNVLGAHPTGVTGTVTNGPQIGNGYTWWNVDFNQNPDGWVVGEYIRSCGSQPPPPPSGQIGINSCVEVDTGDETSLNVRSAAAIGNNIRGSQPTGSQGTVTGGPTTASGYTWWDINFDSDPDGWATDTYLRLCSQ